MDRNILISGFVIALTAIFSHTQTFLNIFNIHFLWALVIMLIAKLIYSLEEKIKKSLNID